MNYDALVLKLEGRAANGLDQAGAKRALHATLATLAERISRRQARDLAAQLPVPLKPALQATAAAEQFSSREFVRRVADREQVSRSEAYDHVRAVFNVLAEAVTAREIAHVREGLPGEFGVLFRPPGSAKWPDTHARRPH